METLPQELRQWILDQLDLETLVALREVNRFYREYLEELDASLIHHKVIERAPWFENGSPKRDSWMQCAQLTVNRTRAVLKGQDRATDWFIVQHFDACLEMKPTINYVDTDSVAKITPDMKYIFSDSLLDSPGKYHHQGPKMLAKGIELDLSTALFGPNDYDPDSVDPPDPTFNNEVVSPSGLKLQSKMEIQVLDENNNLLLIAIHTGRRGYHEHVVHKRSCPRDGEVLIIDTDNLSKFQEKGDWFIRLLPGSGGALMTTYHFEGDASLTYIEPTAQLRHVVICFQTPVYSTVFLVDPFHRKPDSFVLYDGFLFFCFEGRLARLWVDLGVETRIPRKRVQDHNRLPQQYDTQCLTGCHPLFPAMGTFYDPGYTYRGPTLVQGSKQDGLEHFVTVRECGGYVVANLKTGQTWQADDLGVRKVLVLPYISGQDSVGFISMYIAHCERLHKKLERMYDRRHDRFHWGRMFKIILRNTALNQQLEKKKAGRKGKWLLYDPEGEVLEVGPVPTRRRFEDKYVFYDPDDFQPLQYHVDHWEDHVFESDSEDDVDEVDDFVDDEDEREDEE